METFSARGKTVTFHEVRGMVLSDQTETKTEVSFVGGGGHIGPRGGRVAPPQVRATHTDVQSLWIRTDEGRDDHFSLVGSTAAVAGGQRVVMILGKASNSQEYFPVVLANLNSQRNHLLGGSKRLANLLTGGYNDIGPWLLGLLSFAVGVWMMIHFDQYSPWHDRGLYPLLFGPGFAFLWWMVERFRTLARWESIHTQLEKHLVRLGRQALA